MYFLVKLVSEDYSSGDLKFIQKWFINMRLLGKIKIYMWTKICEPVRWVFLVSTTTQPGLIIDIIPANSQIYLKRKKAILAGLVRIPRCLWCQEALQDRPECVSGGRNCSLTGQSVVTRRSAVRKFSDTSDNNREEKKQ